MHSAVYVVANRRIIVMKKLALQKIVTLIATLALGSGCIANDALARGDVGFSGGGTGDGSFKGLRENAKLGRSSRPFFYGDYWNSAKGFECWKTQDVPTNAAWRLRQDLDGPCY
jgi:hypothetical protein